MNKQRAAEEALHDQTNILPFKQLIVVFTGLAISLLMTNIDQNGISVTLPTIARDLNAQDTISWAGTSSLIANTMFTVLYGRFSDIFGRKIVYLSALVVMCIADLLCGLSQTPAMFYVFRGLAGVATGGIQSLTMIIVSDVVTLEQRGKYQGILGAALGVGNVCGPFLAAGFTMNLTWRGFFWLISPLAALSAVQGQFLIPNNARKESFRKNVRRIDGWGILASSIGVIFVLIPVSGGGSYFRWDSPLVISLLTIGGCAMVAFVIIEWKVATLPMLPSMCPLINELGSEADNKKSGFLQEQSYFRALPAELSFRRRIPVIAVLSAPLLPKCSWCFSNRVCGLHMPHGYLSIYRFYHFWAVHLPSQAIWRGNLGRVRPLDLVSCHFPCNSCTFHANLLTFIGAVALCFYSNVILML